MIKFIIIEKSTPEFVNIKTNEYGKPLMYDTKEEAEYECLFNYEEIVAIEI